MLDAAQITRFTVEFDRIGFVSTASGWDTAAVTMGWLVQGGLPIAAGIICCGGKLSSLKPTPPTYMLRAARRETPL